MNVSSKGERRIEPGRELEQLRPLDEVDLVEDGEPRLAGLADRAQDRLRLLGQARLIDLLPGVDQEHEQVGVGRGAPGGGDHRPVEAALGREQPGRVDEHDLRLASGQDAAHGRAGGLRLAGDDRDLLADQRIDEGRLAGVGRADDGDEPASGRRSCRAPAVEKGLRRRLFRGPLGTAGADFRLEAVERDPHDEMGRVRRTAALDLLVAGRRKRARLGPFLHCCLGVAGWLFVGGDAIAPAARE